MNLDTCATPTVAPSPPQIGEVLPIVGTVDATATPGPITPPVTADDAPRPYSFSVDLTEPEGEAIEALRLWTRAQYDPDTRAELFAWDDIKGAVELYLTGDDEFAHAIIEAPWTYEEAALFAGLGRLLTRRRAWYRELWERTAQQAPQTSESGVR